jgi:hypothetical protein
MSNRVRIVPTRFEDVRSDDVSFGVRILDDDAMTYDNSWDAIPTDDLEVLARVLRDPDQATADILASIPEHEQGCYVDSAWYTWDQIKHLWADQEADSDESDQSETEP